MKLMAFLKTSYIPSKLTGKSERTMKNHKTTVRGFAAWYRDAHGRKPRITDLSRASLDGYKQYLVATGRKHSTVNKIMANLSALWKWAYLEEIHPDAPRKIERLPEIKCDPDAWTTEELRRILVSAAEDDSLVCGVPANIFWPTIIWTVFNSGGRISAIMSIRWADVDLDKSQLKIRGEHQKHKQDQRVGLMAETAAMLRELQPYSEAAETVFGCWKFDRGSADWPTLNKGLRKILIRAGLPTTSRDLWHKLRRTFATQIFAKGGLTDAQRFLGHSSPSLTKRYIDPSQSAENNQADFLVSPFAEAL